MLTAAKVAFWAVNLDWTGYADLSAPPVDESRRLDWKEIVNGPSSQLTFLTHKQIGEVFDLSKQRGQQMVECALREFRKAWFLLYEETISAEGCLEALAAAACYEPARSRCDPPIALVRSFAETWYEETGEDISEELAVELLALA